MLQFRTKIYPRLFEAGDHVKVASGSKEGEIGAITSVKGHVVTACLTNFSLGKTSGYCLYIYRSTADVSQQLN